MGLIATGRLRERLRLRCDTWYWRARYWWMDTDGGATARAGLLVCMALVVVLDIMHMALAARDAALHPHQPQQAVIWWVVYLVVALIAAVLAYALMPKTEAQQPQEAQGPTVEDGRAGIYFWGTHWMDDTHLIEWKIVGRDPIKAKGGK